ncbi:hypothetical protein CLUG_00235 [Clavispora lusitaniae ATCC 42720]|uniref:Uncharacterized protein n=1 Tax=Clavispora lusitaniae (strain ATCC 42720) TaxID=306902 RepID=C4XWB2_CLAL4|nr:uncharacterized protein CLUG_00235 [Clavispora lusitaniae ATCC 42720]EEQ36112.1 hypothetical protein CLUG_00235 [Clavispora lusitaniae ATCC 42720]
MSFAANGKSASPPAESFSEGPFGLSSDPASLKQTVYSSASTIISQTIYSLASTIFSFESLGAENFVDGELQLWAQQYRRPNAVGAVPPLHRLEPRTGAAHALLGYARNGAPTTAVLGCQMRCRTMQPSFSKPSPRGPICLHVSAVDYDVESSTYVSSYAGAVAAARAAGRPVVSAVDSRASDLQHSTIFAHFLSAATRAPALHVFDGPEFARTFARFHGVMSVPALGRLYQQLLAVGSGAPASIDAAVDWAFATYNKEAGTNLQPFEYVGHASPETVFVVHGAHEAAQLKAVVKRAAQTAPVGVVTVRVPFPFSQARFTEVIPLTTKNVVVLSAEEGSALKADAAAALFFAGRFSSVVVDEFIYPPNFVWSPITVLKVVTEFAPSVDHAVVLASERAPVGEITANTSPEGAFLVWAKDNSDVVHTAGKLALSLSLDNSKEREYQKQV